MAVPRNRHSNSRKNTKRAHHAKKPKMFVSCKNCGEQNRPHTLCVSCGVYDGRQVMAEKASS